MKLGFCGLGLMGAPMARKLLAAGHELRVWNRSRAKAEPLVKLGATWCDSPERAAQGADGLLMCLMDASAAEQVVFGADGVARASGLPWLVDHSSIPPEATRAFAARLRQANGADWIDAPVSGGVAGVEAGTLTVMAGGNPRHMDRVRGALVAYAGRITHLGDSGAGQAAKLCNQTIVATTVAAIAEAVAFATRNGLDARRLTEALAGGWADSKPLQVFVPRMVQAQPHSIGALSTMLKDVDTVMAGAQSSGLPMPVMASVQQQLRAAAAQGLAAAELSAIVSLLLPELRDAFLVQAHSS